MRHVSRKTVWLLDPDQKLLDELADLFEQKKDSEFEYHVKKFKSIQSLWRAFRRVTFNIPDILITENKISDNLLFLNSIKGFLEKFHLPMPYFVLSKEIEMITRKAFKKLGCSGYLVKNGSYHQIVNIIEDYLIENSISNSFKFSKWYNVERPRSKSNLDKLLNLFFSKSGGNKTISLEEITATFNLGKESFMAFLAKNRHRIPFPITYDPSQNIWTLNSRRMVAGRLKLK